MKKEEQAKKEVSKEVKAAFEYVEAILNKAVPFNGSREKIQNDFKVMDDCLTILRKELEL